MRNIATENVADLESIETQEWLESLDYVLQSNGPARAGQLLQELIPGDGEAQFSYVALCADGCPLAWATARRTRQFPTEFGHSSSCSPNCCRSS